MGERRQRSALSEDLPAEPLFHLAADLSRGYGATRRRLVRKRRLLLKAGVIFPPAQAEKAQVSLAAYQGGSSLLCAYPGGVSLGDDNPAADAAGLAPRDGGQHLGHLWPTDRRSRAA